MAMPVTIRESERATNAPQDPSAAFLLTSPGTPRPSGENSRRMLEANRRQRARERHERLVRIRRRRAGAIGVLLLLVVVLGTSALGGDDDVPASKSADARRTAGGAVAPASTQLERAAAFARTRAGNASFAVVDTRGGMQGIDTRRPYTSASLVKAMILVAYLDLVERRPSALTMLERSRIEQMIRRSDNRSATRLANVVGVSGLRDVARRAGMRNTQPVARPWGLTQTTAEDQARLFARIDRLAPARYSSYARRVLASIVPEHRWGIPRGVTPGSTVLFKGGWLPGDGGWMVHQVAKVERGGRRLSVAVMTDDNPSQRYGEQTVEGVAARLLR